MNLAINGQDAMVNGGKLVIKTSMCGANESQDYTGELMNTGSYVVLSVSDNGCGMDSEVLEHLFEPFYSTKGDFGNGLGLATVYGIVKQHGGNVIVSSNPGAGTTVRVYLRVSSGKEEVISSGLSDVVPSKGSTGTILLVEDNDQVRILAEKILVREDYTLLVAEDGPQALKLLKNHDGFVDLLLTDVVMPGMNGKQLYEEAIKIHPQLKVVYMSGYSNHVVAHHGILDEGVAFVKKPFEIQSFLATVQKVLGK
jgi:CheY-like chemotaxis protein